MGLESVEVGPGRVWGTWEELILGGAVLRYGTQDWNVVASELQNRAVCPQSFTPESCKAKYKDLQQRFSGSRAWFEELRKQRVRELKLELARSEDSIGSLESKIRTLEAEKQHSNQAECSSSQTVSAFPSLNSNGAESCGKEVTKDENSAGSFTQDTRIKLGVSTSVNHEGDVIFNGRGLTIRKRRGQRKRKDCSKTVKEASVGESENLECSNLDSTGRQRGTTTSDRGETIKESDDHEKTSCSTRGDHLMEIFDSISQTDPASVFRHRMDSQKRARYRRIIRQHVDISTIRSRIVKNSIKSVKELFSDLLLLANNALVFYSRRTREYKSACSLRDLVKREYKQHCRGSFQESGSAFLHCNPPVKPRSARPRPPLCKDRMLALSSISSKPKNIEQPVTNTVEKSSDPDINVLLQSLLKVRKGLKRPVKVKSGSSDFQAEISLVKQRKRKKR